MADKIFPWTEEIVPEIPDDYIWDCIDTTITEIPNLISWCETYGIPRITDDGRLRITDDGIPRIIH